MNSIQIVEEFYRSWSFARQMTHEFIAGVPEEKWNFTPHPKYSPLSKQFRHMIWVTGLYRETLATRNMKATASKKSHYSGALTRAEIQAGLAVQDAALLEILESLKNQSLDGYEIQALGMTMGFTEFSHVILHHESNHHGLWSMYAALGGFQTPQSWVSSWGL